MGLSFLRVPFSGWLWWLEKETQTKHHPGWGSPSLTHAVCQVPPFGLVNACILHGTEGKLEGTPKNSANLQLILTGRLRILWHFRRAPECLQQELVADSTLIFTLRKTKGDDVLVLSMSFSTFAGQSCCQEANADPLFNKKGGEQDTASPESAHNLLAAGGLRLDDFWVLGFWWDRLYIYIYIFNAHTHTTSPNSVFFDREGLGFYPHRAWFALCFSGDLRW